MKSAPLASACLASACLALASLAMACAPAFHAGPMPGEPKGSYASVAGARVRFVDEGKGPAVVLLHGFASSLETWETVRPALARDHRVIALDLKGFGWSDRPEGDYSPRGQAQLVLALMDARGVTSAAVVAHSWGASVALQMALLSPARVERLALYDAWVYEEQLPTTFHWARSEGLGEALFGAFYAERSEEKISQAFYDERNVSERLIEDVERALERPGTVAAALAATRGQRYAEVEARYRENRAADVAALGARGQGHAAADRRAPEPRVEARRASDLPPDRPLPHARSRRRVDARSG